jgi:cell division protein FtsB
LFFLHSSSYATFVVPLVKAVQEQQQQIESLTTQNQQLELRLKQLEQLVNKISNNN